MEGYYLIAVKSIKVFSHEEASKFFKNEQGGKIRLGIAIKNMEVSFMISMSNQKD